MIPNQIGTRAGNRRFVARLMRALTREILGSGFLKTRNGFPVFKELAEGDLRAFVSGFGPRAKTIEVPDPVPHRRLSGTVTGRFRSSKPNIVEIDRTSRLVHDFKYVPQKKGVSRGKN